MDLKYIYVCMYVYIYACMCIGCGRTTAAHSEDWSRARILVLRQLREDFQIRALELPAEVSNGGIQPKDQDRQLLFPPHLRVAMHRADIKHRR